jgi:hypothetical protein
MPGCFALTTAATIINLPITADGCTAGARSRARACFRLGPGICPRLLLAARTCPANAVARNLDLTAGDASYLMAWDGSSTGTCVPWMGAVQSLSVVGSYVFAKVNSRSF